MTKSRSAAEPISKQALPAAGVYQSPALDRFSWDSLRLLLALDEAGSFRSAASVAGVSLNTIRAKIDRLEHQFGAPLVIRSVEGVKLTQDGRELVSIVRQMRTLGSTASRISPAGRARRKNVVRVTVTEGLGTYWLAPQLVDFSDEHPDLRIQLTCDMSAPDVLFRDVDIAVQIVPPTSSEMVSERLGTLHCMPFASERYLRRFGLPESVADANDHRLVWQLCELLPLEMLATMVTQEVADDIIAIETNTSSAHYLAVAKGAGIGMLPTYARALTKLVRPIDLGLNLRYDIYMVYHRDAEARPEVREAMVWLRKVFDANTYPWFAEEFIHPSVFDKKVTDGIVVSLFDGIDAP